MLDAATACGPGRAVARLAEAVAAGEARGEQPDERRGGKPDDVEVVPLDPLDERRSEPLDRIRAGAALPLAGGDVCGAVGGCERPEGHPRRLRVDLLPRAGAEAEARDDLVRP